MLLAVKLVVELYKAPPKVDPAVVEMSKAVTLPVVASVENVPNAVPPSSKVTPTSVQSIVEAFARGAVKAAPATKAAANTTLATSLLITCMVDPLANA